MLEPTSPDLLTVPAAAAQLGINEHTLYRWCRAGTFAPAVRVGGRHWRISVPKLHNYLHGDDSVAVAS